MASRERIIAETVGRTTKFYEPLGRGNATVLLALLGPQNGYSGSY